MSETSPIPIKRGVTATLALATFAAVVLYLCYRIIEPFLVPLLWGIAITVVFWPVSCRLCAHLKYRWVGALIATTLISALIIAPTIYLGAVLIDEVFGFYRQVQLGTYQAQLAVIFNFQETAIFKNIAERLSPWVDLSGLDLTSMLLDNLRRLTTFAVDQTSRLVGNFSMFLLHLGVVVLTMFFLFRDGELLLAQVKEAMPLTRERTEELFSQLYTIIRAALYGGVLIAVLQGLLGGLTFIILGLPAPALWGAVMGFCSFIPIFGAALVYVPAALLLILQGSLLKGLILLGMGFGVVSTVDNFIRPLVISGRTQMHTLVLFISILGGLKLFGLLGLVMGPVLAAVFISFFNFYLADLRRIRLASATTAATGDKADKPQAANS